MKGRSLVRGTSDAILLGVKRGGNGCRKKRGGEVGSPNLNLRQPGEGGVKGRVAFLAKKGEKKVCLKGNGVLKEEGVSPKRKKKRKPRPSLADERLERGTRPLIQRRKIARKQSSGRIISGGGGGSSEQTHKKAERINGVDAK